jgi:SAM-dependent methyltransferase
MTRVNVGCGRSPTAGWKNYDNSWSVRLARRPVLALLLGKLGMLKEGEKLFIADAKRLGVRWADVTRKIPEPDGSVEVLYSSHMVEHLDRAQAARFLNEARRVLAPGGIIRLAVPDILFHVENYLRHKDADKFVEDTRLSRESPEGSKTLWKKLRYLAVGDRHHQWMYDGESLCRLLSSAGFKDPRVMEPGTTRIQEPGPLDLLERVPESVFVEALNP